MEPKDSLPYLQEPATCPYPEPDQSSPCPSFHFLKIQLNIILPSTPRLLHKIYNLKIVWIVKHFKANELWNENFKLCTFSESSVLLKIYTVMIGTAYCA